MFVSTFRGDLPSATLKSTFFTDATGSYPGGVWYFLPPLPDRVASDQGPGQRTVTHGVVAARRPPMDNNRPTSTPQCVCSGPFRRWELYCCRSGGIVSKQFVTSHDENPLESDDLWSVPSPNGKEVLSAHQNGTKR